ncbi:hypothetical protein UA08_07727 [Talaromyces atroroseus]|uniref:Uncharacterized protein n=1 Tax=Talaromyces atroroseus TaxID=1441469 RepID=A0A225AIJ6_TALAT|nr:hypothetical protein UA08_07727 [Talaromyces atroroseus]OKL56968.1 hypothetical protein UA08_07727 [Talaromyces atroroseus]
MTKNHNSGKDTVLGRKDSPNSATEILDYAPEPKVHPDFMATITHLSARLYKLISLTSALAHPGFPDSLFQYHLLTNNQLDDLARYYDQVWPPTPESARYPKPIQAWIGTPDEHTIDIETKRRRIDTSRYPSTAEKMDLVTCHGNWMHRKYRKRPCSGIVLLRDKTNHSRVVTEVKTTFAFNAANNADLPVERIFQRSEEYQSTGSSTSTKAMFSSMRTFPK